MTYGVISGSRLKEIRLFLGLTQFDFGLRFFGCPQSGVSERESELSRISLPDAYSIWCALVAAKSIRPAAKRDSLAKDLMCDIGAWIKKSYSER